MSERPNPTAIQSDSPAKRPAPPVGRRVSLRLVLVLAAVALLAVVGTGVGIIASLPRRPPPQTSPPSIAGQTVPDVQCEIDFTKRYDVYCVFESGDREKKPTIFHNCKILGFT